MSNDRHLVFALLEGGDIANPKQNIDYAVVKLATSYGYSGYVIVVIDDEESFLCATGC